MALPFQIDFGRGGRPPEIEGHTSYSLTALGKQKITLWDENDPLTQILMRVEESGVASAVELGASSPWSTVKCKVMLKKLAAMGCVKASHGGGAE